MISKIKIKIKNKNLLLLQMLQPLSFVLAILLQLQQLSPIHTPPSYFLLYSMQISQIMLQLSQI